MEIDWTDPKAKVSKYFSVKECLYLPTWSRMANESDGLDDIIKKNLQSLCHAMDEVREYFDKPITVHVTYRPDAYNKLIGGAPKSKHVQGMAMDFSIKGLTCDEVRKSFKDNNLLELWGMRCEDLPGSSWTHLDIGGKGFFKP